MTEEHQCKECNRTQPEVQLLEREVSAFPNLEGGVPEFESISEQFDSISHAKTMFKTITGLCKEYQRIYPKATPKLNEVCNAYIELDMMVNLHERLLYPYFNVLNSKLDKHTLFDGSIFSVISVLQNSSDKIRAVLNMKQWEQYADECPSYHSFSNLLTSLSPKILAYLDMHDRYIYPEAIRLEEIE